MGNRVAKLVGNQITEKYLWQDKTTLLAVYNSDDSLKQRFEYTLGNTPTSFTQLGQKYYIVSDHLGSPRVITDSNGNIIKTMSYDSFGNTLSDSNPTFTIPFGFAGGLYDVDTGLIRFGYRDYDSEAGRWTARDPIGLEGGDGNIYAYVGNDPIRFFDPFGLAVSGQTITVPGTRVDVRIVENTNTQKHAHINQKGKAEIVINKDGTGSHSTDPKDLKNKKVWKYLQGKGFKKLFSFGSEMALMLAKIVARQGCAAGSAADCQVFELLGGEVNYACPEA